MLESRLRQELIAVQVRCDRLAREVIRIGTYTYKTTTQSLPSPLSSCVQDVFVCVCVCHLR
jgi:hypothetical protein